MAYFFGALGLPSGSGLRGSLDKGGGDMVSKIIGILGLVLLTIGCSNGVTPLSGPVPPPSREGQNAGSSKDYRLQGEISTYRFASPTEYGFERTIVYYIPKSIANPWDLTVKNKGLMFLHGGGESTASDANATAVAEMYVQDFVDYAEKNQVIVIAPTTPFGWGQSEITLFPALIAATANEVGLDTDKIVLAGHSMGGMGITRDYPYVKSFFSGVLALSAGTQDYMMTEDCLVAYLTGTPYIHQNGKDDHFETFDPQEQKLMLKLADVEKRYGRKANFKYVLRPGGHNYDLALTYSELDELFGYTRNHFPKYAQITLGYGLIPANPANGMPQTDGGFESEYWIRAEGFPRTTVPGQGVSTNMEVRVDGQTITLNTRNNTLNPESYALTLSSALLDLAKPVTVILDGKTVFNGEVPPTAAYPVIRVKP
jgi:hypothetical protein